MSSVAVWSVASVSNAGASLTSVTVRVKSAVSLSAPSLAVTRMSMLAGVSASSGVPEKVRVFPANVSQPGRFTALPLPSSAVAVYVRAPPSGSVATGIW